MREQKFSWGPLARGIYTALISFSMVVALAFSHVFFYYVLFLIFLGLGFRPLLERSGLYDFFQFFLVEVEDRSWKKITDQKRVEVERKERDKRYRLRRKLDSRLPKDW